MKKTQAPKPHRVADMATEYRFDYSKAKPNRFAAKMKNNTLIVVIDPDIAEVFKTEDEVNQALRALITALPKRHKEKISVK